MLAAMRIQWTPTVRSAAQRRDDRGSSTDQGFDVSLGDQPAATASAQGSLATQALAGLISLQEIGDALTGRRRALQRGERLLDALEDLRLGLLSGTLPRGQLAALVRLSREQAPLADDPRLAEILAEIELRAAVELAKLERIDAA